MARITDGERIRRLTAHAKRYGETEARLSLRFMVDMRNGLVANATAGDRLRAAENLLDRFGFPRLSQSEQVGDFPTKLVEVVGILQGVDDTPPSFDVQGRPVAPSDTNGHSNGDVNGHADGEVAH